MSSDWGSASIYAIIGFAWGIAIFKLYLFIYRCMREKFFGFMLPEIASIVLLSILTFSPALFRSVIENWKMFTGYYLLGVVLGWIIVIVVSRNKTS